ncbi:hypothetical protein [Kineothrix sedimenti]|uniref:ATP-binding protein n=1 Tax=Kineothrix sedimenti TaxID=3123317 RepID=A0ABZ3EQ31_9FIRM
MNIREKNYSKEASYCVRVGIKKGLKICGAEQEIRVVNELSKYFAITFSKAGVFKTTNYVFDFLQPGQELREFYNLYNEVLLLFSPYKEFEARTLDFVDKTLEEYDNRLDKVCVFLVSNDINIETKIRGINSINKDARIIVPFTYNEILKKGLTKNYISDKLRNYFYNRDLFALESPLKTEAYFYGRTKLVQELFDKYLLGEQSGLFGLRKTGKTSVLYSLERQIISRKGFSLYIDCQNPGVYLCRWNELLAKIIKDIAKKYEIETVVVNESERYIDRNAAISFEEDIFQIHKLLRNTRILLMFDEIEHICFTTAEDMNWKTGRDFYMFWQTIRSVFQKAPECFTFVLAGVNPLCIESSYILDVENPIFDMVSIKYLELFNLDNVKDMIEHIGKYMGLRFDEEIYTKLTEDYGGHPFLIRHICSLINKEASAMRPCIISKYEYDAKKEEYDSKIVHYVEMVLSVLKNWYPKEYELLEILAVDGNEIFKKNIDYREKEINHLIGYGIIKEINKNYYITINAVSLYIDKMHKIKGKPTSKEETWTKISLRRNKLEESLRKLMQLQIAAQYGSKKTKSKLLEVIESSKRSLLEDKEINDIITNHFFLLDVKKVILKNWSLFEKIFIDKSKFDSFLDIVNKHRVDAHAKTIEESDMLMLTYAFNWFDECLKELPL